MDNTILKINMHLISCKLSRFDMRRIQYKKNDLKTREYDEIRAVEAKGDKSIKNRVGKGDKCFHPISEDKLGNL